VTEGAAVSLIRYDVVDGTIARVVLDRPDARNAQSLRLLYELDEAFQRAAADDAVRVVILSGEGPHFSAGHDLKEGGPTNTRFDEAPVGLAAGIGKPDLDGIWAREDEAYFGLCQRWRALPKPTIAQVHGKVIAAGLMLAWSCDLIVAADDTIFQDPVAGVGIPGVELFAHPWELGPRKALEVLYTADAWTAEEAHSRGMVNHVVPRDELAGFCLDLARRIATKSPFALRLIKEAVRRTLASQGQDDALRAAFYLHQLAQAQSIFVEGFGDLSGLPAELQRHWAPVRERIEHTTERTS
jgi:enoyl-CoA hydratase